VSTAPAAPRPTARAEIEDLRAAKLDLEAKAEELLRSGTVKPVRPRDVRELLATEGFRLLGTIGRRAWARAARRLFEE
jgi:hypothetical protein